MNELSSLLKRLESILERIEPLLPPPPHAYDFANYSAFRWVKSHIGPYGYLEAIRNPNKINFSAIRCSEKQIKTIKANTLQFIKGYPANNVLLTGSKGTGKSSLVKACLNEYQSRGLKLIEIDSDNLSVLPSLLKQLENEPYKFIIFCDDLSFEENDPSYKSLKAILDGSLISPANNVLIYATSNRRHLLPEYMHENIVHGGEIHRSEAMEEKISLSERFGLWLSFYPFSQKEYIEIIKSWLNHYAPQIPYTEKMEREAIQFSLQRGSRSGRVAEQFVRNYIGQHQLDQSPLQSNTSENI